LTGKGFFFYTASPSSTARLFSTASTVEGTETTPLLSGRQRTFAWNNSSSTDRKGKGKMTTTEKVRRGLDKLAVKNQVGLSTSQLMLVNEDLKPGEH
jgi:hypothetical protein